MYLRCRQAVYKTLFLCYYRTILEEGQEEDTIFDDFDIADDFDVN